jgi:hypothetical protein
MARAWLVRIFIAFVRVGNWLGWGYLLFNGFCIFDGTFVMRRGEERKWITKVTILRSLCMDDFLVGGFAFWFEIWQHCELGVGFF